MNLNRERMIRTGCALLLPFFTCAVQWRLWPVFRPFVWFLFFPTVFFSSRIGGKSVGIVSTLISAALVVYVFIPPQLAFAGKAPNNLYSVVVFLFMGFMFSYTHDRLEQANRRAAEAELQAKTSGLRAERNRVTEELIKSEERLRLALDATSDGLWDWDVRSGVVFRSPRYYELVCRHPDEDRDGDFGFFTTTVHPDDLPHALATIEAHVRNLSGSIEFDYRLAIPGAEAKWVRVRGRAVRREETGAPLRIVGTLTDITERKKVEQARRESEASLRQAQRLAKVGNWNWDTLSGAHYWCEEVYRIYGRDPSLPPAAYPEVAMYFTPESWERLGAAVEAAMKRGDAYECDAEVVRPNGERRWIVAQGNAERDAGGTIVRLYGTIQDITERKRAEEEIRRLNVTLEQRVEQRTAELVAANRELDSFAYAVSHDLRAPLRAMSGFSQALLEDYAPRLEGEARLYLEQIVLASRQMGELVDGLLTLSRCTRGELRRDPVGLSELIVRLRDDLARQEPERRVAWEIEPDMWLRGDPRMLEVVMRNLVDNAWKYTRGTAQARIRVYSQVTGGARHYCVADNGAGFDMAFSHKLFIPFQRLHRQDEFPGIGIGLATVQRIIHRHGGEIWAAAAPGAGATFSFSLPETGQIG